MKILTLLIILTTSSVTFSKVIETDDRSYTIANKVPLSCQKISSFKKKLACLNNNIAKSKNGTVKNIKKFCSKVKHKNFRTMYTCYKAELTTAFVDPLEDVSEL